MTKPIFLVALKPEGVNSAIETCYRLTTYNFSRQFIPVADDPLGKKVSLPCGKPMSLWPSSNSPTQKTKQIRAIANKVFLDFEHFNKISTNPAFKQGCEVKLIQSLSEFH